MEFDHLKGFYHVAKLGSFTEAATRLYLTQPAISLQVKALEKEVGERLFDRVGRKIKLTHAGKMLFRQAEELLAKLEELQDTVRELKNLERGRLGLGASDTTSIYFLPDLLKSYRARYPGIELCITSLISEQVVRKVLDREVDLGLISLSQAACQLEAMPLFEVNLVCIVDRTHPLNARKVIGAEELVAQPLILLERGSVIRQRIDAFLACAGSSLRPVMELSNFEIIKRYVAAGLGVSIVSQAAVQPERDRVSILPLRPDVSVAVGAVFRKDRKLSHPARAFLGMVQEHFRLTGDSTKAGAGALAAALPPAIPGSSPPARAASREGGIRREEQGAQRN